MRHMIGEIVTFHTMIKGNKLIGKKNQIKIHKTKDGGNQSNFYNSKLYLQ